MNAQVPFTPDTKQQDRRRKRKAILAGGVVLGLGAAVTLAAWSDDVFAGGTFATGEFELQGDVGDGYASYGTPEGAGELTFQIAPLNMAPGETVYAPISIATSEDTTTGAEVTLAGATSDADNQTLFNALRYSVASTAQPDSCDASAFTGDPQLLVPAGSTLGTPGTPAFTVGAGQAEPEHLCFAVTLPDSDGDGLQGLQTGPVVWQFSGESLPAEAA